MALFKIDDRYPDYKDRFFGGNDVKGTAVYTHPQDEKIGSVHNVLVDEADRIRYLVVDTGAWVFGKKILLPISCCIDQPRRDRSYATDLTKSQIQGLPEYKDEMVTHSRDAAYSASRDAAYASNNDARSNSNGQEQAWSADRMASVEDSVPVELSVPVEQAGLKGYMPSQAVSPVARPTVVNEPDVRPQAQPVPPIVPNNEREPDRYAAPHPDQHRVQLYEERLVADKYQQKTGEVTISKRVELRETETSLPLHKEKIIIEIESVGGVTRVHTPDGTIQNGESVHMDVYGEQATLRKEPVVYQDVSIRKEKVTDVVTARETLRREELDVQAEETPDRRDRTDHIV